MGFYACFKAGIDLSFPVLPVPGTYKADKNAPHFFQNQYLGMKESAQRLLAGVRH
jgi:hypothetical protein